MDTVIHPTAIVEDGAIVGSRCSIGPYCLVGAGVRLSAGNKLVAHVSLTGDTFVGVGNIFYPFCSLGAEPQLRESSRPGNLRIGRYNVFREGVTAQGGTIEEAGTRIGDHNRFLANCHIGHDVSISDHVIVSNNSVVAGHVVIEERAYISGLVGVHQFVSIGQLSFIAAGSMVSRSVLPFCLAEGNRAVIRTTNAVGLKRAEWSSDRRTKAREYLRALIYGRLAKDDIIAMSADDEVAEAWRRFASATRRGLALPRVRASYQNEPMLDSAD